jgi:hypothetical protein
MSARRSTPEELTGIDPMLGKNVSAGTDLRTIYHQADTRRAGFENFLQMQAALYLSFTPTSRLTLHLDRGMSGTTQVFGMAHILPWNGFVKAGRFRPAFGWRWDDHTLFARQKALLPAGNGSDLGGAPPPWTDVGVEAGISPGRLLLTASVTNGTVLSNGLGPDSDRSLAAAGQALYRVRLGPIGAGIGGSGWRNEEEDGTRISFGPYGYLKWGPVAWLGDAVWSTLDLEPAPDPEPGERKHFAASQQIGVQAARGFELLGTVDFFDPDLDVKNGTRSRFGLGAQYMPVPFFLLQGFAHFHRFEEGDLVQGDDFVQGQLQAHFFY